MGMITLRSVAKAFGGQTILDGASLQINAGDRYALVGPNGAGKSTLFKMLLGLEPVDDGKIELKRGVKVGYLPQENAPVSPKSVLLTALGEEDLDALDGRVVARAKALLMGLGFRVSDFERPIRELSGGWAMRAALAKLLMEQPDLLMLDEPTNHLDIDSLFWFQRYLQSYEGAVFLISHDRAFINAVCRSIVSLQDHALKVYPGNYEKYLAERQAERERLEAAYRQQQEEIAQMEDFVARNRARFATAGRAQSVMKKLDKLERLTLPPEAKTVKIRFPQPARTGVRVLALKNVSKSYGATKVYEGLDFELERGWKIAFVGHNGAGKSTLLKVLGGIIPFDSGERVVGTDVRVGYFSQHREGQLTPGKTVLEEAMSASRMNSDLLVRTVLGTFLFPGDSVHKEVDVLSGGEKSRLQLVKLLLDPPNVLLLDEPTTHLDMPSVDALIGALKEFEGTVCCISHDLYFLNALADHVLHVDGGKITLYPGDYEYFKHRQAKWREENPEAAQPPPPAPVKPPKPAYADEKAKSKRRGKLEEELLGLYAELESLAAKLAEPALYEDYAKAKEVGDQLEQVQQRVQVKEAELETLR